MAQVTGIGGIFVRADDPKALEAWYDRVLGFPTAKWGGAMFPGKEGGLTLWTPFGPDSDKFAPSTHPFMLNLVVDDLDGVLARAKAEGVEALGREDGDYGRFAWLMDPAGVKLELWEPAANATDEPET
jgi:catechol 2,3-dioxygenase-like lactoylglutathione lyase family enzyme